MPDWPDAVLPAYGGGSIANLPASVMAGMGVSSRRGAVLLPPVSEEILPLDLLTGARVVVLVVIDGLGSQALEDAVVRGGAPGMASSHHQARLTSVFPPTTAAATTSLQYGVAPGTHGMAGYTLYLRDDGDVFNMITWRRAGKRTSDDDLPEPESFLTGPNLFSLLAASDVDTAIVSNVAFASSPLTRAQATGVRYRGYRTLAEFSHLLLREVERPGPRFVFGYWDGYDALGHTWGSDADIMRLELGLIDEALREGFFNHLAESSEDVVVIVTADHGHTPTPREQRIDLTAVPGLLGAFSRRPTGEPRQLGLAFSEGQAPENVPMSDLLDRGAVVLDMAEAISKGLYGPPPHHRDLLSRTGELLLLARAGDAFSFPGGNSGSRGGHGSLTAREMHVPLLVWRYPLG